MNKKHFERLLARKLRSLPRQERQASLNYYAEMIQDRIEKGMSEEAAVSQMGDVDEIAAQICCNESETPKKHAGITFWQILLLILGSPIWLSVLIVLLAVALSGFAVLWCALVSLYAAALALGFIKGIVQQGVLLLAAGCVALGLALIVLPLLNRLTGLLARFTRWSAIATLKCLKWGRG